MVLVGFLGRKKVFGPVQIVGYIYVSDLEIFISAPLMQTGGITCSINLMINSFILLTWRARLS